MGGWLWLLAACAVEDGDTDRAEVACAHLDTVAIAAHEVDGDGTIWLDATGSTACDEALYSWWEVTEYEDSAGGVQPDRDVLADYDANATEGAIYTAFNAEAWAGEDVRVMLSICPAGTLVYSCYGEDRLGFDTIEFTVPE